MTTLAQSTTTTTPTIGRPTAAEGMRVIIEAVTPELAAMYLQILDYQGQRPVRKHHVARLATAMQRGGFRQGTTIETMAYGDREYLIDGQHRLHAVVESGTTQTFVIKTTRAASMEDIAFAYGRTDIGMRRSAADMYSALGLAEKLNLPTDRHVNDLAAAINYMLSGCLRTGTPDHPPAEETMIAHIKRYAPYMHEYVNLATHCENRMRTGVFRAATLAVAMLTMRFAQPYAEERGAPVVADFWKQVIFDDGLTMYDPRKFANRHLRDTTMASAATTTTGRTFVTAARSTRFLASCFNSYMLRREVRQVKVYDEAAPLELYGVPKDPAKWW